MAMPIVRVSQQTYDALSRLRVGFESADKTVARAVAVALSAQRSGSDRSGEEATADPDHGLDGAASGAEPTFLPQAAFRAPLLECMAELGGRASVATVRKAMERRLAPRLGPDDKALTSSGAVRWWNFTQWNRQTLVEEGLFRSDSPRGVWELSEKGRRYMANGRR